jgi:hypothetical protein
VEETLLSLAVLLILAKILVSQTSQFLVAVTNSDVMTLIVGAGDDPGAH